MDLKTLGWNDYFEALFNEHKINNYIPARVIRHDRSGYTIKSTNGIQAASASGRHHISGLKADLPCVGDWVAVEDRPDKDKTIIQEILPRKSKFSRKVAGELADEQIVATNVDTIFLVSGLDNEFNERRIERYLTVAWDSGATPVVILNKADVCDSPEEKKQQVEMIAPGVEIMITDAKSGTGVNELEKYCEFGKTVAFLGSSGVGKSTLVNYLIGEEKMKTGEIREDDSRGRHTTSHRELFFSPQGGLIIDTPGMREIQLWGDEETLASAFADVEELGEQCKFRNCIHENEPGCAVQAAVESGELAQERLNNYIKLKKELDYAARKKSTSNKWEERARDKEFGKMVKRVMKEKKFKGKK